MGLASSIFGSGEGGTSTQTTTPIQAPQLEDLFGRAQGATAVAPGTAGFQAGQEEAAQAFRGAAGGVGGFLGPAQQAQNFLLQNATDPSSNPALQSYLQLANDQLQKQFQQQTLPSLKGQAVAAGNVGSSRAGIAEGLATQGLQDAQASTTANILQGAYGQGLNAMTQGLALTPSLISSSFAGPEGFARAAGLTGSAEQAPYQAEIGNLQNYLNLIGGNYGGTTTTTGPGTETGGLPGLLGLLSSGAGIYSALNQPLAAGSAAAGLAG